MKKNLILSLLLAGAASATQADEARLLRFPATNGQEVVFTYAGDLYKAPLAGGEAQRLTSHIGYEMFARFSPDGQNIAFTGQYDGNTEVFLMPKEGGQPQRLTYSSTNSRDDLGDRMGPNNIVMTWTKDGRASCTEIVSMTASRENYGLYRKKVACRKRCHCPKADSVATRRTERNWLTTA